MSRKPAFRREVAEADISDAAHYYWEEAGENLAVQFINLVESAIRQIGLHPSSGSPRYAAMLEIEALRFVRVARFPYLIFYVEKESHVDIWRVLHGDRDIPTLLNEEAE